MAEAGFNRLKGNVDRIERSIATAERSLKTNKKFAEGVDYSEKLRAKSLRDYKLDQNELKTLKEDLRQAKSELKEFVAEERSKKGEEEAKVIKRKYQRLEEALGLQFDPTSDSAEKIKDDMDALVDDYRGALTSINKRAVNKIEARAKLTGAPVPTFGTPSGDTEPMPAPATTPAPPKSKVTTGGTTGGKPTGDLDVQAGPYFKPDKPTGKLEVPADPGFKPAGKTGDKNTGTVEQPIYKPGDKTGGATGGSAVKGYDALLAEVQADYSLPDIIFSNVKSLGAILDKYVNQKINIDQFKKEIEKDTWYRQNSAEIKARYLQKFNFQDLVKSGNAKGTTDYEQKIAQITNNLIRKSRELGSAIDEGQAKLIAEDLYIHNQDADDAVVTRRLVTGIRPIAGMIGGRLTEDYSGLALQNYQGLQGIAKRNGFRLEDILPRGVDGKPATAQETLQRLALGEIDPTRLEQDVRKLAAVGQPQFVRDLLGQGIDLDEIYSPYRKTMARILELDEGQIDLTDPTLRMGINEKGDVNLFDYSKALRQDSRWQYTGNAREEVSDAALTVLRNFGFQG
jgi:hypothetical protein